MEGMLRREIDAAHATLDQVEHGDDVTLAFSLPDAAAASLLASLSEAGHGRIIWLADDDEIE
jgi:L-fucose mutarotase/ribose pyranase (RbsD/FucU family)